MIQARAQARDFPREQDGRDDSGEGSVRIESASSRRASRAELEKAGWLVVVIDPLSNDHRGSLGSLVDEATERALERRGGAAPGIDARMSLDVGLGDQLFRARRLGCPGIALVFESLAGLARRGALDPDDSQALRFWVGATRERPIAIVLDPADVSLGTYGDPVPLAKWLGPKASTLTPRPKPVKASERQPLLPGLAEETERCPPVSSHRTRDVPQEATPEPPSTTVASIVTSQSDETSQPETRGESKRPEPLAEAGPDESPSTQPEESERAPVAAPQPQRSVRMALAWIDEPAVEPAPPEPTALPPPVVDWAACVSRLEAARGPQSLGSFERLFVESYLPLVTALDAGLTERRAHDAALEFRNTFSRVYTDALPRFVLTGRRPRMVFDAPELAGRSARLHGARATTLLLVDGLRSDIGAVLRDSLVRHFGERARLTEEQILWAALPSTTTRQLELLARGIEGLRNRAAPESESEVLRGRSADIIRRVKIGSRDLHKLDVIEARLRDGGDSTALRAAAVSAARAISRFAQNLAPRTLLYVFGDHGFSLDRETQQHGGASPEEVLVPAFGFLLGDVH